MTVTLRRRKTRTYLLVPLCTGGGVPTYLQLKTHLLWEKIIATTRHGLGRLYFGVMVIK